MCLHVCKQVCPGGSGAYKDAVSLLEDGSSWAFPHPRLCQCLSLNLVVNVKSKGPFLIVVLISMFTFTGLQVLFSRLGNYQCCKYFCYSLTL